MTPTEIRTALVADLEREIAALVQHDGSRYALGFDAGVAWLLDRVKSAALLTALPGEAGDTGPAPPRALVEVVRGLQDSVGQAEPPPADTAAPMPHELQEGDVLIHDCTDERGPAQGHLRLRWPVIEIQRNGVTLWRRGSRTP